MNVNDLTGQVFTNLTVIERTGTKHRRAVWECRCVCGAHIEVASRFLTEGITRRCSHSCPGPKKEAASVPTPMSIVTRPSFDVDRNRERYVRLKLAARSVALDESFRPFSEYTCAECPSAPKCEFAFDGYNTDGDCLETK